ncbi:MAG: FG-GAP-like repeat-containing protein [Bryobacteraceae bacterium]
MPASWCALLIGVLLALQGSGNPSSKEELLWQYRNLGKAFYENPTTHNEAADEFRKALALAPDSAREHLNYGLALLRAGDVDQGTAELLKVQKQEPSLPHTWFNLGVAYKKKGEYQRAIEQFRRMSELVPDEPITHYNLGLLYRLNGDNQAALKEFATAARLDPDFVAPRFQTFDVYREAENTKETERALAEFQRVKKQQEAADAGSEDPNWSYYSEVYDPIESKSATSKPADLRFRDRVLPGKIDPETAGMLLLDADADGVPDLLVWSAQGILLYRSGSEPVESGISDLRDVTAVAAGDYNNDGLPDLCIVTKTGPALYLNQKGTFHKDPQQLPPVRGSWTAALWMDYDHDYDLDLFLIGTHSVLLRNQGQAGFQDRTADFPFIPANALDAAAFRVMADTKGYDLLIAYQDRPAVLYRDRLEGRFEAVDLPALRAGASPLVPFDFDNDSWIDLASAAKAKGILMKNARGTFKPVDLHPAGEGLAFADLANSGASEWIAGGQVLWNKGLGQFTEPVSPKGFIPSDRWLAADFDGDGRQDLAGIARDGTIHLLQNQTATANKWLEVTLEGVKNLKLAPGSEVEVKAGPLYQKKIYEGVTLHFGLGDHAEADTIRVTWSNGMIQNLTKVAAGKRVSYKEAPRLSGSCPMIFTWNGRRFEFLTDVLGVAPLGARSGDGSYFPVDHDEYIQIPSSALVERNGRYDLRITEELSEVTYLDQVRLMTLDHPSSVEVFTNDKWKSPPFPDFRLYGVKDRIYPTAARDGHGRNVRSSLTQRDRVYAAGFRRDYAGVAEMHSLDLDFPGAATTNRAVLVLNGWVDWADGSTFYAAGQESRAGLVPPYLQVKDMNGRWKTVIEDMGMPSGKTKTIAVDLTGKFLSASREIRIVTNLCVYWDEIFLAEDGAPPPMHMTPLETASANLHFRGFSRAQIDAERRQPEYFDYARVSPVSQWNPTPGFYTRYGGVRELIADVDDRLAIMGSGDELALSFSARNLPPLPSGWKREFLLLVDGWAKDRDANTAYSQTVEPLPFHRMSRYPYPAPEAYPADPAHSLYRKDWNTRPALRLIRPLTANVAERGE